DQADARLNSIYTASEGTWYRASDARTARTMHKGTTVHVQQGTVSAGFVYAFQTLDPVIGTSAVVLAFYLSEDAVGAAIAASASASAALGSKNAVATSAEAWRSTLALRRASYAIAARRSWAQSFRRQFDSLCEFSEFRQREKLKTGRWPAWG
ncbi:hypothetical protein RM844_32655, partial [Streptomyces sp. DSM 44915]